jgi:hypothetical protein
VRNRSRLRRRARLIRHHVAEETDENGQRKGRDDSLRALQRPASRATDAPDGAAPAVQGGDRAAEADRFGRQPSAESVDDLSVAPAGIEEAAVHVRDPSTGRHELLDQRAQCHALQAPGGDVR